MLDKILGSLGATLGSMIGGGRFSSTAFRLAGRYLGKYITESSYNPDITYSFSKHLDDIITYPPNIPYIIPIIFGKARIEGRLIWCMNLKEFTQTSLKSKYFKDSEFEKSKHYHTSYFYSADFVLLLAEGEISEIARIWINGKEADIAAYKYRFYRGTEDQMPDILIKKYETQTTAFRGISYIVFEDFPLAEFGNKIPYFEFELFRKEQNSVADLVRNICIIPGSGEFIYDTEIVKKTYYSKEPKEIIHEENINCHNEKNIADSLYNLEKLISNFPNLEYVSLVITWFADNLDAGKANIYPAIEDREIVSSIKWEIAGFNRDNARIISRNENGCPNYGGSINDESLIRYLSELKKRNIKILLNPMILLDIQGKPWRGHITGDGNGIRRFFQQYRKFILHYANLTKDYIDAFLIGSELKGLTKIREYNNYPAIDALIELASDVRLILGKNIKISYGADWSEYHHHDGYYNLDPLWASENIDFIGIDAYFPLTNSTNSEITIDEIKNGFTSGEGFEYYDENELLAAAWAWKNIQYWWENDHYNKDGSKTDWIPKSKKIFFTEFGFPSIDKAPNQPNIFYDPKCSDGGVPKYSNGEVDFEVQRKSIRAFLEYWRDSNMVEKSFLWAWDVRPQPAWPHMQIWNDSHLWQKGHWINDKLSSYNLSAILRELCSKSGFSKDQVIVKTINQGIEGLILNKETSYIDIFLILQGLYGFTAKTTKDGKIEFISNEVICEEKINAEDLVRDKANLFIKIPSMNNIFSHIRLNYLSYNLDYKQDFLEVFDEQKSNMEILDLNLPILLTRERAKYLCRRIVLNRRAGKISFIIPHFYMDRIDIGDYALLKYKGKKYSFSITNIKLQNHKCFIEGDMH